MIKKNYAILDHTANVFLNSITFLTDAEAVRWFTTQVNGDTTQNLVALYPEQYTLYRLMDFDDKTGKHIPRDSEKLKAQKKEPEEKDYLPKEIITGVVVKEEQKYRYSIEDIITKVETLIEQRNVTPIKKEA
jgi:hypothetical protein